MTRRPCPTPTKPAFRDRIKAELAAIAVTKRRPDWGTQEAYRCPCGKWHTRTIEKRREPTP